MDLGHEKCRSDKYITNRIGVNRDPWRVPIVTEIKNLKLLGKVRDREWSERKEKIQSVR
jgi:hypothetical protein